MGLEGMCQQRCGLSFAHFASTWVECCTPFLSKAGCRCYRSSSFLKNSIPRLSESSSFLAPHSCTKRCISTHRELAHIHFPSLSGAVESGQLQKWTEPIVDPSKTAVLLQRDSFPLWTRQNHYKKMKERQKDLLFPGHGMVVVGHVKSFVFSMPLNVKS